MKKTLLILGSTGSIGTQTLDIVREEPGCFRVEGLAAARSAAKLLEQVLEFRPGFVAVSDPDAAERELRKAEAVISSMTNQERRSPDLINESRMKRIARGAGHSWKDVKGLMERFN